MASKQMKRYSISLIIRKIQIKITMRCHLTTIRITIIKKEKSTKVTSVGKDGETGIPVHLLVGL